MILSCATISRTSRYDIYFGDEYGIAMLGKVEEFDGTKEDWSQYVERMDHFFLANGIAEADKKRAVFLSVVGLSTYRIIRNLVAPKKPGEKSDAVIAALSAHFKPTPAEIVERCRFHSRSMKPGESVATFVAELRSLSEFCNFGDTLDIMIRDRLVCGINDNAIQRRLLSEPDLTYAKSVELALSMETAAQNVKDLRTKPAYVNAQPRAPIGQDVHNVSGSKRSQPTCFRCGKMGHLAPNCKVSRLVVCHQCGKRGHLQRACKGPSKGSIGDQEGSTKGEEGPR